MRALVEQAELARAVGLLNFVAEVCSAQPEELNVALCRHVHGYFPAHWLAADLLAAASSLARAVPAPHEEMAR